MDRNCGRCAPKQRPRRTPKKAGLCATTGCVFSLRNVPGSFGPMADSLEQSKQAVVTGEYSRFLGVVEWGVELAWWRRLKSPANVPLIRTSCGGLNVISWLACRIQNPGGLGLPFPPNEICCK